MRQAEHLHQVAERALAAVVLPVGVGDEADRRIEREVFGHRGLFRRIERQKCLQSHQRVNDEQAAKMKQQHADRVDHCVLLLAFVDASDLVDRELHRSQDRRQKRPLATEHARHIGTEHRRDRNDDRAVQQNLNPTEGRHGLYPFRTVLA